MPAVRGAGVQHPWLRLLLCPASTSPHRRCKKALYCRVGRPGAGAPAPAGLGLAEWAGVQLPAGTSSTAHVRPAGLAGPASPPARRLVLRAAPCSRPPARSASQLDRWRRGRREACQPGAAKGAAGRGRGAGGAGTAAARLRAAASHPEPTSARPCRSSVRAARLMEGAALRLCSLLVILCCCAAATAGAVGGGAQSACNYT